ncbi:FxLD family lanthipeptide [Streptomyces mirabilis]|uniref:FxLD family lanthipeptide n=1 Tax=Streptomyces mirabilis TaxID=68239 RepID=UPI0035DC109E
MKTSTQEGPRAVRAAPLDPFDLDITVLESGEGAVGLATSDGGCGSTCGTSCVSNGA